MKASFRVLEGVPDGSVGLGFIDAPNVTPSNAIVSFDYSGNHAENVSTFPGRTRFPNATYDKIRKAWYVRSLYATDALLTNRIAIDKAARRTLPLYFKHTSTIPLISNYASFNGSTIDSSTKMLDEFRFATMEGTELDKSIVPFDVEFIPYSVYHNQSPQNPSDETKSLFYIRLFMNPIPERTSIKIRFKALDVKSVAMLEKADHEEVVSLDNQFSLFNVHYQFPLGVGSDLLGYSFSGSRHDPFMLPLMPDIWPPVPIIPADPDPEGTREEYEYSMLYSYSENSYSALLSNKGLLEKPAPMLVIYPNSQDSRLDTSDLVELDRTTTDIILILKEAGVNSRSYRFSISGRASYDIAQEINKSTAPFTCYEGVRVEKIDVHSLGEDYLNKYTGATSSTELFDRTADGGIIIRSTKYIAKYTTVPTIQAIAPVDKSTRVAWRPRIKLGGYVAENGNVYFTNRYSYQKWSSRFKFPYVDVTGEELKRIGPGKYQTSYPRLFNDVSALALYNESGSSYTAFVKHLDAFNGIIYTGDDIREPKVLINYSYKERYFEPSSINLNPTAPHSAEVGKFYNVFITPYNAKANRQASTIYHEVTSAPLTESFRGQDLLLASFYIADRYSLQDYKIEKSPIVGGGVKRELLVNGIEGKVPMPASLFDYGFMDGLRFPANSVVRYLLPKFMKGDESVVLKDYRNVGVGATTLSLFGANKIPPGTAIKVYHSTLLEPDTVVVVGAIDHETVKLAAPLDHNVNLGAQVTFPINISPMFTMQELEAFINKSATAGSYSLVEYK